MNATRDLLFECLLLFAREYCELCGYDPKAMPRSAEDYVVLAFDAQADLAESDMRGLSPSTILTRLIAYQINLDLGIADPDPPANLRRAGH